MLPQIRKIYDVQLFVYVSLTTCHFASASNKKILCALTPPEFSVSSTEKNPTQIHQRHKCLSNVLSINYCTFLIIHFFWLIHMVIGLSYLLSFTSVGFGLIGKNANQQPPKRPKSAKISCRDHPEEKSTPPPPPSPTPSLLGSGMFIPFMLMV